MQSKLNTKELTLMGLMTAIICILGPLSIPIPFSVVPISFTMLAIYFTVFVLGWKKGTICYLLYLLIGLVGVPVFANFSGGLGSLVGPTGGYLIGFIFLTLISGFFIDKFKGKLYMYVLGMVLGLFVTYTLGTAWLAGQMGLSFQKALFAGVIPYLPADAAKIVIALMVGPVLRKNLATVVNN
jgi:biotin transport system substrate-specific component